MPALMPLIRSLATAALALSPALALAGLFDRQQTQAEFLPAEEAFVLDAVALDAQNIQARWLIAPGYYLYRHRLKAELLGPDGQTLEWQIPSGKPYQDEHFGEVEIYRDVLDVPLTLGQPGESVRLRLHWQGCAEAGLCYPPQKREFTLDLAP